MKSIRSALIFINALALVVLSCGATAGPAFAQDAATGTIGGLALIVVSVGVAVVAIATVIGLRRTTVRQRDRIANLQKEVRQLGAFIDAMPQPFCGWSAAGRLTRSDDFARALGISEIHRFDDVVQALDSEDGLGLKEAFAELRRAGRPLELVVAGQDGQRRLQITGRRGTDASGGGHFDVLWLNDVTPWERELGRLTTELQQAQRGQATLRTVLDAVPTPMWLRDDSLRPVWVNQAYASALDLDSAEAIASGSELAAGVIGDGGRALASRALQRGEPQTENHHVVVRGERRLLAVCEMPLGEDSTVLGYALDFTREEEAKLAMERQNAAHAEVLEHLKTAIAIFGHDKRLTFFNQGYVSLWGFEEPWLESRPTLGEILEDQRERRRLPESANFPAFKKSQLALFHSLLEPEEDLLHLPDGTTLRALVTPHPLGGLLFVQEDVTSSLTLERSYNTLIAVQRETLDNLSEGIAVFGGDGRLQLSNPAYATIWGLNDDDLEGRPHVSELMAKTRRFFADELAWDAVRAKLVDGALDRAGAQGRITRTDGAVLDYVTVPLPDGGLLYSFLDVTDSAKVEQALRNSNEALETADRLKSEFIANVSYQLRTPLNAIMGFAEILDNQYFGPLSERQQEYTSNIIDASQRLLALINDILDLATIEAGYMALDRREVDVHALLSSVYDLTREWAGKQNLTVVIECPSDIGVMEADERRLKQALFNLVSNAIKFTLPGGSITLSGARKGEQVRLAVADNGIGIPEADHDRVFGRFERGHAHLRMTGVGLGLALVKSFIEMHGGRIEMKSRPSEGTTVNCILPVRPPLTPTLPPRVLAD